MILEVRNIKKSFKQANKTIEVLKNVSFKLASSKSLAILGKSGSGKSTLLSILSGLVGPDEGEVFFKDKNICQLSQDELTQLRASHIGIIFQQYHLLPHLRAIENVSLALEINKIEDSEKKALEALSSVGLSERADHFPYQLSGGEQQRVAIARSIVLNPDIILADEPSGSLDTETGQKVMDILFNVTNKNALILVTHNLELAKKCNEILYLEKGSLGEYPS